MMAVITVSAIVNQEQNEYLTKNEIEKIRMAQQIDERVKVLMKVADRRLLLVENSSAAISKKEEEQWGPLPRGSSTELLSQYVKAIDETIVNIEDAYSQDPGDEFLYKALKTFGEATELQLNKLKTLRATVKAENDLGELDRAIEAAELANEDAKKGEARFLKLLEEEKAKKKKPGMDD
jgi:hypothetical protein